MVKLYECDKCGGAGKIAIYGHVDNGFCYKCNGQGKLSYDPEPKGFVETKEYTYEDFLFEKRQQELVAEAEEENWRYANNMY